MRAPLKGSRRVKLRSDIGSSLRRPDSPSPRARHDDERGITASLRYTGTRGTGVPTRRPKPNERKRPAMPTYEYACTSCGEHLEVVQSFRDDPLTECPACSGQLRKVFGSIGVVFKGSGFYKTDSRTASSTAKAAQSTEAKSAEAKAKDGSSTAKAAEGSSGKS